jgi:DNA-directed RNA polymerase sigma subunit (sigma70/sigma32)
VNELSHLSKAEKDVVMLRWGLDTAMPLSRAEIADKLSVSKEWVRQLEASALKKLRQSESVQAVYLDHTSSTDPMQLTDP